MFTVVAVARRAKCAAIRIPPGEYVILQLLHLIGRDHGHQFAVVLPATSARIEPIEYVFVLQVSEIHLLNWTFRTHF